MLNHNYVGVCLCLPLSACVLEFLLGCVCVCLCTFLLPGFAPQGCFLSSVLVYSRCVSIPVSLLCL